MADGRLELRGDVRLTFARNGVPYTVTADEADTAGVAGPTGEEQETVVFRGKVRMKGEDGFSVETEEGTYFNVEQRLTFPGAVAFTRADLSGSGVGGEIGDLLADHAWLLVSWGLAGQAARGSASPGKGACCTNSVPLRPGMLPMPTAQRGSASGSTDS